MPGDGTLQPLAFAERWRRYQELALEAFEPDRRPAGAPPTWSPRPGGWAADRARAAGPRGVELLVAGGIGIVARNRRGSRRRTGVACPRHGRAPGTGRVASWRPGSRRRARMEPPRPCAPHSLWIETRMHRRLDRPSNHPQPRRAAESRWWHRGGALGTATTLRRSDEETAQPRRQAEREGRSMHEVARASPWRFRSRPGSGIALDK
jgi:hypothetical protein